MKTSKKTKIALAVLIAASACFAEPGWKNAMKGIEGRIKGNKQSRGKTASSSSASSKKKCRSVCRHKRKFDKAELRP